MSKHVLIIFILAAAFVVHAQTDKRLKGLEKELNDVLKETKTTGFAIAIVEKNKIVYAQGFGYADYENKVPVDANTLFPIGSCSKAFTSSILGQLNDEGKLSFDESPRNYVPELNFFNNELNNNIIVILCAIEQVYLDTIIPGISFHQPVKIVCLNA
jgi:CubicO group peptidase (beta-lactamase class C family)